MKMPKIIFSPKALIAVNAATILFSFYKITTFISEVGKDLFAWWISREKTFSYIHFWHFVTFFVVPLPFGVFFIALLFYLLASIFLIVKIREGVYNSKYTLFSIRLLLTVLGSFIIFIGE